MKKSKYQQYFYCFIVCILGPYAFWFSFSWNIVNILLSSVFRGGVLIVIRIGKDAALIRDWHLLEAQRLIQEIW